ncbi:hypothetical protein KP509_04G088400 [Ceratopteris richardii]|uniref:Cardiolipin synthase n=1 Tax=Ceratopteris richardii TaxID=49495 RepID=A0A8T2V2P9_CERRI|nr:hypothetical protein KP509_04G088400 [Ceratopteris richardii]
MAAGRGRLSALLRATRYGCISHLRSSSGSNSSPYDLARSEQRSFLSSWLDRNAGYHHSHLDPCPLTTLVAAHPVIVNSSPEHPALVSSPSESLQLLGWPPLCTSLQYNVSHSQTPSRSAIIDTSLFLCNNRAKIDERDCFSERSPADGLPLRAHTHRNDTLPYYRILWSDKEIFNVPNAISFGRLLSGPLLAWLILEGHLQPAVFGLIVAGASDWLDGYFARKKGIDSVFGTYLDPLADKVLIGCVAISMAQGGYLPFSLVVLVIARDAALVCGSFLLRAHSLKWQVLDLLNTAKGNVQKVEPLYISKVNTVFQLALIGMSLLLPAFGIEDSYSLVPLLSWCVVFTTCTSSIGYGWKLFQTRHGKAVMKG